MLGDIPKSSKQQAIEAMLRCRHDFESYSHSYGDDIRHNPFAGEAIKKRFEDARVTYIDAINKWKMETTR